MTDVKEVVERDETEAGAQSTPTAAGVVDEDYEGGASTAAIIHRPTIAAVDDDDDDDDADDMNASNRRKISTAITLAPLVESAAGHGAEDAPPPDPSQKQLVNGAAAGDDDGGGHDRGPPDEPSFCSLPLPLSKLSSDKIDFIRGPHNRVKLYVLCNQRVWDDRGTGHVACLPASDDSDAMCIVVRLEASGYENKVLQSRILLDTIYQKQQGTLIVWSETEMCDLALSFQEKAGCAEIWDKICRIQGKDPDAEEDNECDEQEPSDSSTSGISSGAYAASVTLPPCDLSHLAELKSALSDGVFLSSQREKLASAIIQEEYVPKLCNLFQICEDLEDRERLGLLYHVAKSLFLLNSNSLLAELLDEKYFKDIVGMLEYDPSEPKKHREFLWEKSKFREILPIQSAELKAKIHQTYRVQYVLDLCLPAPSLFEENLLTVLSSHLFFNRAGIVAALLNDKNLMKQLFEELKDSKISPVRQRDLTNFLKEFCSFAHSLQPNGPQGREQFFKSLMTNDVLATIDPCISSSLSSTRVATVELLTMIVDFEPKAVRDFFVLQFHKIPPTRNEDLLINKLIKHMLSDRDPEQTAAIQMSNALRILLDPENIVTVLQKGEKTEFLPLFYKRAMHSLCQPILDNAKGGAPVKDDYYTANQLALVIDLFCFFVDHHNYSMRAYTTQKNLLSSVLTYLKSRHHFLALCALRMCRRILNLNDPIYFKYILDKGIIKQVVDCFVTNGPRYNLLNSALIEFFEFIRMEDIRPLMEHVVENHWDVFGSVTYVRTFSAIKIRYDQLEAGRAASMRSSLSRDSSNGSATPTRTASVEPDGGNETVVTPSAGAAAAQWKKEQEYDNDELFFGKDDNEPWSKLDEKNETDEPVTAANAPQRKSGVEPLFLSVSRKRKANDEDGVASIFGGNVSSISNSSSNRPSKIVICMNSNGGNDRLRTASTSDSDSGGAGDSVVSSSSSPPKDVLPSSTTKCSLSSSSSPFADDHDEEADGSQAVSSLTSIKSDSTTNADKNKSPIILKKGLSGLVDYDESDDDD